MTESGDPIIDDGAVSRRQNAGDHLVRGTRQSNAQRRLRAGELREQRMVQSARNPGAEPARRRSISSDRKARQSLSLLAGARSDYVKELLGEE